MQTYAAYGAQEPKISPKINDSINQGPDVRLKIMVIS